MGLKCILFGHKKRFYYDRSLDDYGLISFGHKEIFIVRICTRCAVLFVEKEE